ncbi:glycosyltransferase family 39 protein [Novosphingobium sp. RD2P27]|uniref:Glycosyltransferase family 39 protein n=1 Tax=Novosphingobium kalidii TaxID=3230299 RepID=A0ABV2D3G5_9SPHN
MATLAPHLDRSLAAPARRGRALATPVALAALALATLLFRLGSLWTEQIDWDEWSFVLMGADVAQGHLPFVHQFDLKPPLVFFLFGATIAVFGKSLIAIRLLGAFCILASAACVYLTARRSAGHWPALAGAMLCAALASAPFGLATSSELPAIALLSAAVWRLSGWPLGNRDAAFSGILVALAVLTRTNLAVMALALGTMLLASARMPRSNNTRTAWLSFGLAGLVPPLLLVLVYASAGQLETLRLAMIDVPLAYSGQLSALEVAQQHATQLYYTAQSAPLLYAPPVLLAFGGGALAVGQLIQPSSDANRWLAIVLFVVIGAVACSLLIGGAAYPHYWLQLVPFVGLFAALGVAGLVQAGKTARWFAVAAASLPLAAALATSLPQTSASYTSPRPIAQAAAHIRHTAGPAPTVWAMHKHLIHWYLDAPQLSRASVHPDNLARRAIIDTLAADGYVGHDEVARLMSLRPEFVITDARGKGIAWVREDGKDVDRWLTAHYRNDAQFGDVLVYRRR